MPSLNPPKLDDRTFQDIVDEAKSRIAQYCPEWTDHNVSDPGVTLIELFAWMVESLLYRLNQVPQLHYIKFLQMFGITLEEPVPASTYVTFWLTKALRRERGSEEEGITHIIPAGTEVATTQTETERSIIFTTDQQITIRAPRLEKVWSRMTSSSAGKLSYRELTNTIPGVNPALRPDVDGVYIFASKEDTTPLADSALYLGFRDDISYYVMRITLQMHSAGGANVNPKKPPYVWEVSTGEAEPKHWRTLLPEEIEDTTQALCSDGTVILHLPKVGRYYNETENIPKLYWIRVRLRTLSPDEEREGYKPFSSSPRMKMLVSEECLGAAQRVVQARVIRDETLGRSDGKPGQRFLLQSTPILREEKDRPLTLLVTQPGKPSAEWTEVKSFADSTIRDPHFMLDRISGEVRLGPAVRQPDGDIKCYGATPLRDAILTIRQYRTGGGLQGNVMSGEINTLKSSIPFIERVGNRSAAHGGMDAESLDSAMIKASNLIRTRERAITQDDFEFVAKRVLREKISRVKCIQPYPADAKVSKVENRVYVVVIAHVDFPSRRLSEAELSVSQEDIQELSRRFEERRPLTMYVDVRNPPFKMVALRITLMPAFDGDRNQIEQTLLTRLYRFINPIIGWTDGQGWPFGRKIRVLDIPNFWQDISGVHFVQRIDLFETDSNGERKGEPVEEVTVLSHSIICSGQHSVEFLQPDSKELGSDGASI